jgi:GTP-dependent phosphoenolpyruvate carboxykinase
LARENIRFLEWMIQRLKHKHNYAEDDKIIICLKEIINDIKPKLYTVQVTDEDLDKILVKYYSDFNIDKISYSNIGFTEEERENLRKIIRSLVFDIVNNRIPQTNKG